MGSVQGRVKRGAERVTEDIINRIGGTPFHKAVEELCAAVIELLPNIPAEKTDRLGRALGNLQESSLSQTTSTAAKTIVVAAQGLETEVKDLTAQMEALRGELHAGIGELKRLLTAHLREHEAGK